MEHEHEYDDATGEPYVCPVDGCWFNEHHIHTATLEVAATDGECGAAGTCEGSGHAQPEHEGTCQVDPYMIDVENEIVYRILCRACADQIADDI